MTVETVKTLGDIAELRKRVRNAAVRTHSEMEAKGAEITICRLTKTDVM